MQWHTVGRAEDARASGLLSPGSAVGGRRRPGLICAFTDTFRRLAAAVPQPGDLVVEIGFSYGECSRVLLGALRRRQRQCRQGDLPGGGSGASGGSNDSSDAEAGRVGLGRDRAGGGTRKLGDVAGVADGREGGTAINGNDNDNDGGAAPPNYLGIDNSKQLLSRAQQLCPGADFRVFDVLQCPLRLVHALRDRLRQQQPLPSPQQQQQQQQQQHQPCPRLVFFVDIGGNRDFESVATLLAWLEKGMPAGLPRPAAIVVKSESLFALCRGGGGGGGGSGSGGDGNGGSSSTSSHCVDGEDYRAGGEHQPQPQQTDGSPSGAGGGAIATATGARARAPGTRPVSAAAWAAVEVLARQRIVERRQHCDPSAAGEGAGGGDGGGGGGGGGGNGSGGDGDAAEPSPAKRARAAARPVGKAQRATELAAALAASMGVDLHGGGGSGGGGGGGTCGSTRGQAATRRFPHPLKFPEQRTAGRQLICRFHNYHRDGCFKHRDPKGLGTVCPFDHAHCHACGAEGHVALECAAALPLV